MSILSICAEHQAEINPNGAGSHIFHAFESRS
jgi:hypothetical protein